LTALDEDDDSASAYHSEIDEDDELDDTILKASGSAILKSSDSPFEFVFGSFSNPIKPVSNPSIKPEFDGFSFKVGEISYALVDSRCNIVDGDSAFVASKDDKEKKPETELVISEAIKKMKN